MKTNVYLLFVLFVFSDLFAQYNYPGSNSVIPFQNSYGAGSYPFEISAERTFHPDIKKRPGHYTADDWQRVIDSLWGQGLPNYTKATIFQSFWSYIDSYYACFHNLDSLDWADMRLIYYPLVQNGVSKGRFSGIMSYLSLLLRDIHTKAYDKAVNNTALLPGVPLFYIGGWYDNSHFGAGLTPLPDSSLLVYDAVPQHPLGLQRGDIVLGYDRIPYKILYKEIMNIQMPVTGWYIGSSPTAYLHSILNAAGMNWHLFDTIDVRKYGSGDTIHLPVSLLNNKNMSIICTEQMNIPGVPKPDITNNQVCSYGKIQGTNIGYIYVWSWSKNAQFEFYNAVNSLMNTDGFIIDFRFNMGGNMFLSNSGLSLLFPYTIPNTITFAERKSRYNYYEMKQAVDPANYLIPGRPPGYNKPIAVLTGPGAVSSGDQVALRMKYHPNTKFFGKSTSAAFSGPSGAFLHDEWVCTVSTAESYETRSPGIYLTHRELPVDYNVWLTPEYVAQGRDNVVEAAQNWISTTNSNISNTTTYELAQNFPNPFNVRTIIRFSIKYENKVVLKVYDITGREMQSLVNGVLKPGTYYYNFGSAETASGVYFYKIITDDFTDIKRMVMIK